MSCVLGNSKVLPINPLHFKQKIEPQKSNMLTDTNNWLNAKGNIISLICAIYMKYWQ